MRGQGRRVAYTATNLRDIRALRQAGGYVTLIAERSGVSPWTINRIINHEAPVLLSTWRLVAPKVRAFAAQVRRIEQ